MKFKCTYLKYLGITAFLFGCKTSDAQINVTINPNEKHQTIEGWGVSLAWWANLAGGMPENSINELANYAVNDLNFNVFRFNIAGGENPNCTEGDHFRKDGGKLPGYRNQQNDNEGWGSYNLSYDYRQIKVMNKIAQLRKSKGDIITEMISYSPPWWMTYSECAAGNINATQENLKPTFIDDYADYLVSITKGLKTNYPDWNISYIAPFNEPTSGYWKKGGNQAGSAFYPATQAQVLWRLWQRKNALGIPEVKLTAADNSKITDALANMITLQKNNPNEYNGIAKISTHSYSGDWKAKRDLANFVTKNGNKKIWQTETGPLGWQPPEGGFWWQRHYQIAYRLIEDLRNLKATVWCDWQLMSIDDGWGMLHQTNWDEKNPFKKPTLLKTRGFYLRKNVTNFIKVGYKIISTSDGNTLAALSPDEKEIVFLLVNASDDTRNYTIDLSSFSNINGFKTYRTSGGTSILSENTAEKNIISASEKGLLLNKKIDYNARPFSLTSFIIDVSNTLSTEENKRKQFKVYPNPFSNECLFNFPYRLVNGKLIIYDILGKEVRKVENLNTQKFTFKRKNLKKGTYFYKVVQDSKPLKKGKFTIN